MAEATFAVGTLAVLRAERTVRIETRGPNDEVHRTTIWIVVDGAKRVLIRSHRGERARWYREAARSGEAALIAGRTTIPVRVVGAADSARIEACSRELAAKYAGDPATRSMLREEILGTTLELLPAGPE